jgi:hypothetical protein
MTAPTYRMRGKKRACLFVCVCVWGGGGGVDVATTMAQPVFLPTHHVQGCDKSFLRHLERAHELRQIPKKGNKVDHRAHEKRRLHTRERFSPLPRQRRPRTRDWYDAWASDGEWRVERHAIMLQCYNVMIISASIADTHTRTRAHAHKHTHAHARTPTHSPTHTRARAHTHTHTCARARVNTSTTTLTPNPDHHHHHHHHHHCHQHTSPFSLPAITRSLQSQIKAQPTPTVGMKPKDELSVVGVERW